MNEYISKAEILLGEPRKVVIWTGIEIPIPSALPAVDKVVTASGKAPLFVPVTTSLGLDWVNCTTVSEPTAFVDEPSRRKARHASAPERNRGPAETATKRSEERISLFLL
jgi:hypothetical protein